MVKQNKKLLISNIFREKEATGLSIILQCITLMPIANL